MLLHTLTIVGVGLIGGSIGLAAKTRGVAQRIIGVGRDPANLAKARDLGAIDHGTISLADAMRDADLAIFCTPVDRIAEQIIEASAFGKPGAIFTCGRKQIIVRDIEANLRAGPTSAGTAGRFRKKRVEHGQKSVRRSLHGLNTDRGNVRHASVCGRLARRSARQDYDAGST